MRGNLGNLAGNRCPGNPIPAHTGEPVIVAETITATAPYPRAYGGTRLPVP